MIPPFDDSGSLPPGIHAATTEEIDARFGLQSEIRQVQMDSIRWMLNLARRAGVQRIVLNGSFTTDIMEPNDVDCVLLVGVGYPDDEEAAAGLLDGLPFLQIDVLRPQAFNRLVKNFFATDRHGVPKGVVEVMSWI